MCLLALAPLSAEAAPAPENRPLVIAHRGGALLRPENTIAAFDYALKLGADVLEFDILMTKDDQLVISHDSSVNPAFCTAAPGSEVVPGPVRSLTLDQLIKFDCGSRHRPIYVGQTAVPGARMPTLESVLARYRRARVQFFGEIKMPSPGQGTVDPVLFAAKVEALVRKYGLEKRFILQSFDWRAVDAMHEIDPRIRTCLLGVDATKGDYLELARAHNASCLVIRSRDVSRDQVGVLRAAGLLIFSDVVDDESGWEDYLSKNVSAIFTNNPKAAIRYLKNRRNITSN